MGFCCGIVGLPNVGKSTLFNALTATASAQAANYPFCTIEPNIGKVAVPDIRLTQLAQLAKSQKIIPTFLEFVDIAGLVKGASKGEGLGNQFLGHIRNVDAIVHVLRCFENSDITHVEGSVDPLRDAKIIETELMLADLENVEKRMTNASKRAKSGDKEAQILVSVAERLIPALNQGTPARTVATTLTHDDELAIFRQMQLLTAKPILYACNVSEAEAATGNDQTQAVQAMTNQEGSKMVIVSAAIEAEVALLDRDDDKQAFLASLGLQETGLSQIIRVGHDLLGLQTFFTIGPKEARAWTVLNNATAFDAAGVIHSDFQRGFICAETIGFQDYIQCNGEQGAKEAGKLRIEGRDYKTKDGDIFHFRFNV